MVVFCSLSALLALPLIRFLDLTSSGAILDTLLRHLSLPSWRRHAAGLLGLWICLWSGYFTVGWGLCGATPGKWLLGLRIVDLEERCPIGPARALLRLVAYAVSSVTLDWGHLLLVVRRDHRALHDLLAGTRVVIRRGCKMSPGEGA